MAVPFATTGASLDWETASSDGGVADFLALREAALARERDRARPRGLLPPRRRRPRAEDLAVLPPRDGDYEAGEVAVIDLRHPTGEERRELVSRALPEDRESSDAFFLRLRARLERAGVRPSRVEVRFEEVTVMAKVLVAARAHPTLSNTVLNALDALLPARPGAAAARRDFPLLQGVSGVLCPGRFTLLLGPPGCGRSTLLRVLAGQLLPAGRVAAARGGVRATGAVTYNGRPLSEFVPQRAAALIQQRDIHLGELTVRETLDFAARCQGALHRRAELADLLAAEAAAGIPADSQDPEMEAFLRAMAVEGSRHHVATELMLRLLGLEAAADTVVGSSMLRGISGGEKKRVTAGEALVGGGRKVLLGDDISTGLDSETTQGITASLRSFCHFRDATVLISLLAPPPETYELFDDVMLLAEGRVVFHGRRQDALPFLAAQGLAPPPGAAEADFLVEVLAAGPVDQARFWARPDAPYRHVTAAALAAAFVAHRAACATCSKPDEARRAAGEAALLPTQRFALSWAGRFRACASRDMVLLRRNAFVYIFRTGQVALAAVVAATLFLHTRMRGDTLQNGTLLLGYLFFSITTMFFTSFSEMALQVAAMPVYDKQAGTLFYDASSYAVSGALLRAPVSFVEAAIWTGITYFAVGLAADAGRWFTLFGLLMLAHFAAGCLFRCIAAVGRNLVVASTLGSVAALIFFTLSGFVLSRPDIPGWWIGGYWVSPLAWAQKAVSVSEFTAPRWHDHPAPAGAPGTLGAAVLSSRGLPHSRVWAWVTFPVLLVHAAAFTAVMILALRWLAPTERGGTAVSEAELQRRLAGVGGEHSVTIKPLKQPAADGPGAVTESAPRAEAAAPSQAAAPADALSRTVLELGGKLPPADTAMPFAPAYLSFRGVEYFVPMPGARGELQLLRDLDGAFLPGRLTALMGTSGAGKTTLMDVLAGRKTAGRVAGDVRINGHAKEQRTFTRISGYVEQADVHAPATTVREAVAFSAEMRLAEASRERRRAFVEEILALVELSPIADALVGVPGASGLSVEQRKRLTIAVELVGNPAILFLDEPTSGLDARAAALVMRAVRAGADTGRAVVATVHQPSAAVFAAFDELLLLKRGGECVYAGPLGAGGRELVAYIEGLSPAVRRFREGTNPATWVLSVTSDAAAAASGVEFAAAYAASDVAARNTARAAALATPPAGTPPLHFASPHARTPVQQFRIVLRRNLRTYWRSPQYNLVRFVMTALIALFFGTVFWQRGTKRSTLADVYYIAGAMYAAVIFLGVNNASTVQPVAGYERDVAYRERAAGMYSAMPWALALQMVELPYVFAQTVLYTAIIYSAMGFEASAPKIFWFALVEMLTLLAFTFYGQLAVALTPHVQLAAVVSSFFYSFFNLFAGFLIPVPSMPWWWRWYAYLDPVQWTVYGLVASQLGDVYDGCVRATPDAPCTSPAAFVRHRFGYHHDFLGGVVGILAAFCVVFTAVAAIAHAVLNFQRR